MAARYLTLQATRFVAAMLVLDGDAAAGAIAAGFAEHGLYRRLRRVAEARRSMAAVTQAA